MDVARLALQAAGSISIKDEPSRQSFDFSTVSDCVSWFVEAKGTTRGAMPAFMLTANEIALHQDRKDKTVLHLVSGRGLSRVDGSVVMVLGVAE